MAFYNLFTHLNTMNNFNFGLNSLLNPMAVFTQFNVFNQPFNNLCSNWNNSASLFNFNTPNIFMPSVFNLNTSYNVAPQQLNTNSWCTNNYTLSDSYNFSLNNSSALTNKTRYNSSNSSKSQRVSGNINNSYANLSKSDAYKKALGDSSLENLSSGGRKWKISSASFKTDIPFAKKGTGIILDRVAESLGVNLIVTSALGTGQAGNPHQRGGYSSHHNAENPKLDLKIPTGMNSATFAQKLRNTGYFSHVLNEGDHVDVQINPEKFRSLEAVA